MIDVAAILRAASQHGIPVTARGSGTGLSGACRPIEGGSSMIGLHSAQANMIAPSCVRVCDASSRYQKMHPFSVWSLALRRKRISKV